MTKRKTTEIDEDGFVSTTKGGDNEPLEAFVNDDLINDFLEMYSPGTQYSFTHIFTRPMLRQEFGAYLDFNTVDPLPSYLQKLAPYGFKEKTGINHEPCIYVVEKEIEWAEEVE